MQERNFAEYQIRQFHAYLLREEKSAATVEKYLRDVRAFSAYVGKQSVTKNMVVAYKKHLQDAGYAARSINSMLASVNGFLAFMGWQDCRVKSVKLQRRAYCAEEKELTKAEYERLLKAAEKKPQLRLVMQTICGTGIEHRRKIERLGLVV